MAGLPKVLNVEDECKEKCKGCMAGKMKRVSFTGNTGISTGEVLELVHSDVCGPMKNPTLSGTRYYVAFIDDYSRFTFVYPMTRKDQVFDRFMEFKKLAELQTGKLIKRFRSDGGGEYDNQKFEKLFKECGIQHEFTAPYCPEQNGVLERANRTIVEKARSMLHFHGLPYSLWGEAVSVSVYIKNRVPTKQLGMKTPYELWTGKVCARIQLSIVENCMRAHTQRLD